MMSSNIHLLDVIAICSTVIRVWMCSNEKKKLNSCSNKIAKCLFHCYQKYKKYAFRQL